MKIQISLVRKDGDGEPIPGWAAHKIATYPYLVAVLEELAKLDKEGVAELGADYNDDEDDALFIVWANYPYFTDGSGSLRDMWSWVGVRLDSGDYFGNNRDGEEWSVPLTEPNAASIAAQNFTKDLV